MGPSRPRRAPLNHNVFLTLMYAPMLSMYSSLLAQTPLAAFMSLITHDSNLDVGLATGTQGVVSLLVAIPASVLADRFGRQVLRRRWWSPCSRRPWACACPPDRPCSSTTLFMLVASSAQWGVFMGLHAAARGALGDSIESGARSLLCAARAILRAPVAFAQFSPRAPPAQVRPPLVAAHPRQRARRSCRSHLLEPGDDGDRDEFAGALRRHRRLAARRRPLLLQRRKGDRRLRRGAPPTRLGRRRRRGETRRRPAARRARRSPAAASPAAVADE